MNLYEFILREKDESVSCRHNHCNCICAQKKVVVNKKFWFLPVFQTCVSVY